MAIPRSVRPAGGPHVVVVADAPAWIRNGRADVLATNRLGRALYASVLDDPLRPANTARFTFLNPRGPEFYRDWKTTAKDMVAVLRAEAGRNPLRPRSHRPGRRTVHPQRDVSHPVGHP